MKFKYYLRGCGFGILFTALVLTISFYARGGVMTDEKAMLRASELGMVMPDGTESVSDTQEDTQDAKPVANLDDTKPGSENPEKTTETEKDEKKDKSTENDKNKDTQKSSEKDSEDKKDKDKEQDNKNSNDENDIVTVTVRRGEVCRELAEDLYEKGLVDDAEKFRKYMQDSGYDSKICVGTFRLNRGMTYAQIARALVTKPE